MTSDNDALLARWLRACRRGDERSARLLHARLSPGLTRYARSILGDAALADDAVQSAFCRVLAMPPRRVRRVRSVGAWMAMLVRREALSLMRARRRERARVERRAGVAGRIAPAGDGADDEISRAVDALPRRLREVVVLKHVGGLTYDQIALALGANANTVAARHRRAVALLAERLGTKREVAHA